MVVIGGVKCKAHYLAMDLPQSDDSFVMAFPAETTEAFLEGHNHAFAYFGGVPRTILYDNTKIAVARILGDGTRMKTRAFSELQSHYLFAEKFGRPARATTKGKWKGWWATRGATSWCRFRGSRVGKSSTRICSCNARSGASANCGDTSNRSRNDSRKIARSCCRASRAVRSVRQAIDAGNFDSLVRYRTNDYSVPVEWGHREVLVKGFVHEVVICAASEVIARHRRSYEREDMIFDPLHYLALLKQKPNALDQAAPLQGWLLPEGFPQLQRLMEARLGKKGKREYVQTLRLLETFRLLDVSRAVDNALGSARFPSMRSNICCCAASSSGRRDWIWKTIRTCPQQVATTAAADYLTLLSGEAY